MIFFFLEMEFCYKDPSDGIMPLLFHIFPVLQYFVEKHSHIMMLPPSYSTVDMVSLEPIHISIIVFVWFLVYQRGFCEH